MGEFDLITKYFLPVSDGSLDSTVALGVGDDCALIKINGSQYLAASSDTLVENTHFLPDTNPASLAEKALAVAFSDLAAMGVESTSTQKPKCLISLTLPNADKAWIENFSQGIDVFCKRYQCCVVGGDTTKGPLAISVTVFGILESQHALKRSAACVGDSIFVTGQLGSAAAALHLLRANDTISAHVLQSYERPVPRFDAAQKLQKFSVCAIDISDGLVADLGHICKASNVCADIDASLIPIDAEVVERFGDVAYRFALSGGDDYQLCFTVANQKLKAFETHMSKSDFDSTCIGKIVPSDESATSLVSVKNLNTTVNQHGYDHFA